MSTISQEHKSNVNNPSQYFVRAYLAEHALQYGYVLQIDAEGEINEIKCQYTIKYIKVEPSTQHYIFNIDRGPVYINSTEPDTLAEELASKIGAVLYPLELEVNLHGAMQNIHNHPPIVERWTILKRDLLEYYEGDVFLKYITLSEQALLATEILFEKILQDWFLCTYFASILGAYKKNVPNFRYLYLPIDQTEELVRYLSSWSLNTEVDEHGEIEIKGQGEVDIEPTSPSLDSEVLSEEEPHAPSKGSHTASYKLNAQNHVIESINCITKLTSDNVQSVKVDVYRLGQIVSQEPKGSGSIVVKDKWAKKEGFWSKIFKT